MQLPPSSGCANTLNILVVFNASSFITRDGRNYIADIPVSGWFTLAEVLNGWRGIFLLVAPAHRQRDRLERAGGLPWSGRGWRARLRSSSLIDFFSSEMR